MWAGQTKFPGPVWHASPTLSLIEEAVEVCGERWGMRRHKESRWWNEEIAALDFGNSEANVPCFETNMVAFITFWTD